MDMEEEQEQSLLEKNVRPGVEDGLESLFSETQGFLVETPSLVKRHVPFTWRTALMVIVAAVLMGWLIWSNRGQAGGQAMKPTLESTPAVNFVPQNTSGSMGTIMVDVHGDVVHPGVYKLPSNSRVQDAIQAAGGFQHAQDSQLVNAAAPLDDGQEVLVPGPGSSENTSLVSQSTNTSTDSPSPAASGESATSPLEGAKQLDLNTADESSLQTLPGIGPSRAAAIVNYRNQHGGFKDAKELQNISGIGPKTWGKIQSFVCVTSLKDGQKP